MRFQCPAINPARAALLSIVVIALSAQSPGVYQPPPPSAGILSGVPFASARPVGEPFRKRFLECDSSDTCDGKKLPHGCKKDKNSNTVLLELPGKVIFFDAKLAVDADGSRLAKKNQSGTDSPDTSLRYPLPGEPSIDADKVPYIAVPGGGFRGALGVETGDIAAVIFKNKIVYALVADVGPACKIGEGSIRLHTDLEQPQPVCLQRNAKGECTKIDENAGLDSGVLFFIFPGSKSRIFPGLTPENVNERLAAEGPRLMSELRK